MHDLGFSAVAEVVLGIRVGRGADGVPAMCGGGERYRWGAGEGYNKCDRGRSSIRRGYKAAVETLRH